MLKLEEHFHSHAAQDQALNYVQSHKFWQFMKEETKAAQSLTLLYNEVDKYDQIVPQAS